jgi:hypothetical protein
MIAEGSVQVFHESSGYVFEVLQRGGWAGGVRAFSQRGSTVSARTATNVTGYSLSGSSVHKIGRMFPDVATVMRDTFVRRQKTHCGAMWKITWKKHRHAILTQAAGLRRPPYPWPAPRQRAASLVKAEATLAGPRRKRDDDADDAGHGEEVEDLY